MKESNLGVELLKVVGIVLLIMVIITAAITLTIGLGYLIGMFIAILPFVSDWLVTEIPIDKSQIPTITAWLAVASLFLGSSAKVNAGGKNGDE